MEPFLVSARNIFFINIEVTTPKHISGISLCQSMKNKENSIMIIVFFFTSATILGVFVCVY